MTDINVLFHSYSMAPQLVKSKIRNPFEQNVTDKISSNSQFNSVRLNNHDKLLSLQSNQFGTHGHSGWQYSRIANPEKLAKNNESIGSLEEQTNYFKKILARQTLIKFSFIAIIILILRLLNLYSTKTGFQLIQLTAAIMLADNCFIENRWINKALKFLPGLTYLALVYDLIGQCKYVTDGGYDIILVNIPVLLLSIVCTINFIISRNIWFLSDQSIKSVKLVSKIDEYFLYNLQTYNYRVTKIVGMWGYFTMVNLALFLLMTLYCLFNSNSDLFTSVFNPFLIIYSLAIFFTIDCFNFIIQFLNSEVSLFRLNKHINNIPIDLSLLRAKPNKSNKQIQTRCLLQILKSMKQNPSDSMSTLVNINKCVKTYQDIFEIHSNIRLGQLKMELSKIETNIRDNIKIINSQKTMKKDLFIHLRKFFAKIQNDYFILKMLKGFSQNRFIFMILFKLNNQHTQVQSILTEHIREISQKITNVLQIRSVPSMINQQLFFSSFSMFQLGERKLMTWSKEINSLLSAMTQKIINEKKNAHKMNTSSNNPNPSVLWTRNPNISQPAHHDSEFTKVKPSQQSQPPGYNPILVFSKTANKNTN